ncbi:MAG TPA: hypothetical protein DIV79_00820 [Opitutae bacterium]|nr:hypothetical protein [Opitutaceae bacterium]MEC7907527.1 DUF1552 domain-containing protein [Verrucomicrobiota bacterium]HCR28543.1 hypothetical protein [Opitutae bacterium]
MNMQRRRFLKSLGISIALPAYQSLVPQGIASSMAKQSQGLATTASGAPLRTAYCYFPNGVNEEHWWPLNRSGKLELNRTMKPLDRVKTKIQAFGGLDHINATAGKDGAGDHARASATFLTGERARKTAGKDIRAGVSIDQIIANEIGSETRFPSLELTCDTGRKSGRCDSGYACAYQYNISWQSPTTPVAPEANPRAVFERLFGGGPIGSRKENFQKRLAQQRSILDFVMEDAKSLRLQADSHDTQKLDEYLTSVRAIEKRIQDSENIKDIPDPNVETPAGIPERFSEHMGLMYDMMGLAFQTDSTRVATLQLAHEGMNTSYPEIGIDEGHHYLSHHKEDPDKMEKIAIIDRYYLEQFAHFLHRLDAMEDVDGNSVLDNSMIVYGCGHCDGNRHTHDNLPILLAGKGGGELQTNRFVHHGSVPMTNLYLGLAEKLGIKDLNRIGDSTGVLTNV